MTRLEHVVLDIDGCLVGCVVPQLALYELAAAAGDLGLAQAARARLLVALKKGLLRPGVAGFVRMLRAHRVPVHIYTASERQWAHFLVGCIEQVVGDGFAFERPLRTRDDCDPRTFTKALRHVGPAVVQAAARGGVLIVDNTDVFPEPADRPSLWLCPTYARAVPETAAVPRETFEANADALSRWARDGREGRRMSFCEFTRALARRTALRHLDRGCSTAQPAVRDTFFANLRRYVMAKLLGQQPSASSPRPRQRTRARAVRVQA